MKLVELEIQGVYSIELFHASDHRGSFTKTYHKKSFDEAGLESSFQESFFSINKKNVLRGMHFQLPPHDHAKLVYSASGRILDVIVDLRKDSPTFGRFASIEISDENHLAVYMPKGVAHGFFCITESIMVYLTSTMHNKEADSGIRWDSFGMDWPSEDIIMSDRDKEFVSFNNLNSPF